MNNKFLLSFLLSLSLSALHESAWSGQIPSIAKDDHQEKKSKTTGRYKAKATKSDTKRQARKIHMDEGSEKSDVPSSQKTAVGGDAKLTHDSQKSGESKNEKNEELAGSSAKTVTIVAAGPVPGKKAFRTKKHRRDKSHKGGSVDSPGTPSATPVVTEAKEDEVLAPSTTQVETPAATDGQTSKEEK